VGGGPRCLALSLLGAPAQSGLVRGSRGIVLPDYTPDAVMVDGQRIL
jgi:hypothetical protein